MPVGIVIMKWDERVGTEIVAKYPREIVITDKTLMQVYSTHEYSGDTGMISMMVGALNIASYYTGEEQGLYMILLLNLDDDPDSYEGGLADFAQIILQNLDDRNYVNMIPSLFQRLSVYPTFNDEQLLMITYEDEIKRMIINRLREEGVVSKSELMVWLKDKYQEGFVDTEGVVTDLIKREIIKGASIKGMVSESVFLTYDILITRIPPTKILKNPAERGLPAELVEDYKAEVKKFFQTYRPSEDDNLSIIKSLINPQVYETIRLLRMSIVTRNELEKLKKKGVDDIDDVLKELWDNEMIQVLRDDRDNEYFALLSNFFIGLTFPKYILSVLKEEYEQKSKSNPVLLEYFNVLEDTYLDMKAREKEEKAAREGAAVKIAEGVRSKLKTSMLKRSKMAEEKAVERIEKAKENAVKAEENAKEKAAWALERSKKKAAKAEEKARIVATKAKIKAKLIAVKAEQKAKKKTEMIKKAQEKAYMAKVRVQTQKEKMKAEEIKSSETAEKRAEAREDKAELDEENARAKAARAEEQAIEKEKMKAEKAEEKARGKAARAEEKAKEKVEKEKATIIAAETRAKEKAARAEEKARKKVEEEKANKIAAEEKAREKAARAEARAKENAEKEKAKKIAAEEQAREKAARAEEKAKEKAEREKES